MLSMSNIASARNSGRYFAEDNYYSAEENTAHSQWQGEGAAALGLAGEVQPEALLAVLEGRVGGQQLGRYLARGAAREHRPGVDITLSAPKSVSLLAEADGRREVRQAHEAAVDAVLHYAERYLAMARTTCGGVTERIATGKLLVARFQHNTSRGLDPQTHTHLVIANATQLPDGSWRSLSNEPLYGAQKLMAAIYDSELAANLRGLGYRIEPGAEGGWEVAGFTRTQLEHFSQRSIAIEERLARFGLDRKTATAAQKEDAALRTRVAKRQVDHAALSADWRERATLQGIDFQRIELERARGLPPLQEALAAGRIAAEAVRFAASHLTERESVIPRDGLLATALNHAIAAWPMAQVRLGDLEAAMAAATGRGELVAAPGHHLTTHDAMRREQLMLALLEQGRGQFHPLLGKQRVLDLIEAQERERGAGFTITSGQEMAVLTALGSRDRFVAVQGFAGSGKTTMLQLVRQGAQQQGVLVRGMAPSAEAAAVLEKETGIPSATMARFLVDQADPQAALWREMRGTMTLQGHSKRDWFGAGVKGHEPVRQIWVMDESSLAGTNDMLTVMHRAQAAGARLLLVGDRLQLNAVAAGKPFEMLLRHGIDHAEMTEISRQRAHDLRAAVAAAAQRNNQLALSRLSQRLIELPHQSALLDRMAGDVIAGRAAGRNQLILVPRKDDRETLNQRVRSALQQAGAIGPDLVQQRVLVAADLSAAQTASAAYLREGMVLRFGKGLRAAGLNPGSYAEILNVNVAERSAVVRTETGAAVVFRPGDAKGVEAYLPEWRALGVGDELRFGRNEPGLHIRNGSRGTVAAITEDRIALETPRGMVHLARHAAAHQHWDYGYALTIYAAQGKTADAGGLLISSSSGRAIAERAFYVGITRYRDDIVLYTDSKTAAMRLIATAIDKTSALEALDGAASGRMQATISTARDQSGGLER